jgi:hypothetical protein
VGRAIGIVLVALTIVEHVKSIAAELDATAAQIAPAGIQAQSAVPIPALEAQPGSAKTLPPPG